MERLWNVPLGQALWERLLGRPEQNAPTERYEVCKSLKPQQLAVCLKSLICEQACRLFYAAAWSLMAALGSSSMRDCNGALASPDHTRCVRLTRRCGGNG